MVISRDLPIDFMLQRFNQTQIPTVWAKELLKTYLEKHFCENLLNNVSPVHKHSRGLKAAAKYSGLQGAVELTDARL